MAMETIDHWQLGLSMRNNELIIHLIWETSYWLRQIKNENIDPPWKGIHQKWTLLPIHGSIVEIIDIELCHFHGSGHIEYHWENAKWRISPNQGIFGRHEREFCILLFIPVISVCHKLCLKMFYFDLLFDSYHSLTLNVKLRSTGLALNWVIKVYMHTKYENNCLTGSWDMPNYVFSTSGDLVSKVKGQGQLWPHGINGSCDRIY